MAAAARTRLSRQVMGRLRLASQGLLGAPPGQPAPDRGTVPGMVRWMTAIQGQDLPAALWAVGQRVPGAGSGDIRSALDRAEIVRSWPLRGTLHLVAPEDLRWMLAITSERVIRGMAGRHRELGITADDVEAARGAALRLVSGGAGATREQLFQAFRAAGQPTAGQRGVHLLGILCQRGWLVLGPLHGRQQLVVAFDEWITKSRMPDREEATAELLRRYLRSRGPATERDFAWWSGLPLKEIRAALAAVRDELACLEFEGSGYWLSPEAAALLEDGVPGARSVFALPAFDEFLLSYADRSLVLPPGHADRVVPGGNGVFKKIIVAGGEVTGTWSGPGTGRDAAVVPEPFDPVNGLRPAAQKSFERQAAKYRRFLAAGQS